MSFTHSFRATFPPARFDAVPWTRVRIEESADGLTGWTQIDEQALTPDPTPATPNAVNVTVTTAQFAAAWFRFRFDVTPSSPSTYTAAIRSPEVTLSVTWAPSTSDVAALMFSRVTGEYAEQLAEFTDSTRPTLGQVAGMIDAAVGQVASSVGITVDAQLVPSARFLATLYTALLLEPSYWQEQQQPDKAAWEQWHTLYDDGLKALLRAIEEVGAGDELGPSDDELKPIWAFPVAPLRRPNIDL